MSASFTEKIRPDEGDHAAPLCYGDIIMLSCLTQGNGIAYLCEEGCVMKQDPHVEMRASSRELTFEVFSAHDTRAMQEIHQMLRKYAVPVSEKLGPHLSYRYNFSETDTLHFERLLKKGKTEELANAAYSRQLKGRAVTYGDQIRLKHTERQAFLGIDVSQAPRIESSAKRIYLTSDPYAYVKFKIIPRFRYLTEGNTVCFGDNVSLASADHPSEYLHTSAGFTSEKVGLVFEVNLSPEHTTIWSLECFVAHNSNAEAAVKAGDVVRLFHPFLKGFVGAVSVDDDDQICFESSDASSSQMSSTMWVVEADSSSPDGLLRSIRTFTLMHLVTQKHLVVSEDTVGPAHVGSSRSQRLAAASPAARDSLFFEIVLSSSAAAASRLLLQPLEDADRQANSCIPWGGLYRIVDAASGRYLHIADSRPMRTESGRTGLGNSRGWAGRAVGEGRTLVASPALFRDDFFEVQRVPDDQVQAVGALSRMLPALREHRDALQSAVWEQTGAGFPSERVVEIIERLEVRTLAAAALHLRFSL